MKKFATFLFVLVFVVSASISFGQTYKKGVNNLNAGVSIGGLAGFYGESDFPPVSVGLQFGIHEKISVGGIVGYASSSYGDFYGNSDYEWTYRYIVIGARGEYHFIDLDAKDFDVYGGLTIGYNIVSFDEPDGYQGFYSGESSYMLFGFHAGGRYLFSKNIGALAELGYGIGYFTIGLNVKL
jgi:hypothetical protein